MRHTGACIHFHFNDPYKMHFQEWAGITRNGECYNLRGRGRNLVLGPLEARNLCEREVWDLRGILLGGGFAIPFSTTPSDLSAESG